MSQVAYDKCYSADECFENGGVKSVGLVTEPINSN